MNTNDNYNILSTSKVNEELKDFMLSNIATGVGTNSLVVKDLDSFILDDLFTVIKIPDMDDVPVSFIGASSCKPIYDWIDKYLYDPRGSFYQYHSDFTPTVVNNKFKKVHEYLPIAIPKLTMGENSVVEVFKDVYIGKYILHGDLYYSLVHRNIVTIYKYDKFKLSVETCITRRPFNNKMC